MRSAECCCFKRHIVCFTCALTSLHRPGCISSKENARDPPTDRAEKIGRPDPAHILPNFFHTHNFCRGYVLLFAANYSLPCLLLEGSHMQDRVVTWWARHLFMTEFMHATLG
jgi:hypothetical protein